MQSCTNLYLPLHAHATEIVRPVAQSAKSAGRQHRDKLGRRYGRAFHYRIAFFQSSRLGRLQKSIFLSPWKSVHGLNFREIKRMFELVGGKSCESFTPVVCSGERQFRSFTKAEVGTMKFADSHSPLSHSSHILDLIVSRRNVSRLICN